MENVIVKLNTQIDINQLIEYYNLVKNNYEHKKWIKDEHLSTTNDKWKSSDSTNFLHGWAIDSNLESLNEICPPLNITTKATVDYRNTELAFGIIDKLQKMFPYGYRWAISVLEPNGYVNIHSDNEKNVTVWIPIINPKNATFMIDYNNEMKNYYLPADGSIYVVDTKYPHCTKNNSQTDRVLLSFRCGRENLTDLLNK